MKVSNRANYQLQQDTFSDPSNVQTTLRRFRDNHKARWSLIAFFKNIEEYTGSRDLDTLGNLLVKGILLNDSHDSIKFIKDTHLLACKKLFQDEKKLLNNISEDTLNLYSDLFCLVDDDKISKIGFLCITIENLLNYLVKPEYFSIEGEIPEGEIALHQEKSQQGFSDAMSRIFPT